MGSIFDLVGTLTDKGQADKTPPRNIADEISAILNQAPNVYRAEAALSPFYNDLRLSGLDQLLWGSAGGPRELTANQWQPRWRNLATGQVSTVDPATMKGVNQNNWERFEVPPGTPVPAAELEAARKKGGGLFPRLLSGGLFGGNSGSGVSPDSAASVPLAGPSSTVETAPTVGLVEQFLNLLAPANAANTASRTATYNDIRGLNPAASTLFDDLTRSASLGLAAGSTISPEDTYRIVNPIRSSAAARGFMPGGPGDLEEALALFGGGQDLLARRQATAGNVADLGSRLYTLPTLANSTTTSPGALLSGGLAALPSGNVFDQLAGYGSNLFGQNYSGALGTNLQNANNEMNMWLQTGKQMSSDFGTLTGGAGLFCWAAREIFGYWNNDWSDFRDWLLSAYPLDLPPDLRPSEKLRKWYTAGQPPLKNLTLTRQTEPGGLLWACRLKHARPGVRAAVRRWMQRRVDAFRSAKNLWLYGS